MHPFYENYLKDYYKREVFCYICSKIVKRGQIYAHRKTNTHLRFKEIIEQNKYEKHI